uniref:ODAD1 central coiled coil region domain-containing protein n=1 Tax=Neospora caninum (strain Liverpool) TaxID=572307 RepID=A0A0F7U951_NEOCL|nr:TPA: hypothetical protein BN1204_021950 [Neospora caninum Liverpool]
MRHRPARALGCVCTDPEEIVAIFSQLEERNYSIMTYVNTLNFELEAVEAKTRELESHIQQHAQHEAIALQVTDASLRDEAAQISKMLFATAGKNALVQHQLHCLAQTHEILTEATTLVGQIWKGPVCCDEPPPPGTAEECAAVASRQTGVAGSRGASPTARRDCSHGAPDGASSQGSCGSGETRNILPLLWYLEKFILANQGNLLAAARSPAPPEVSNDVDSPTAPGPPPLPGAPHSGNWAPGGSRGQGFASPSPEPRLLSPSTFRPPGTGTGHPIGTPSRRTMCTTPTASNSQVGGTASFKGSGASCAPLPGHPGASGNSGGPAALSGYGGSRSPPVSIDPREEFRTGGSSDPPRPVGSEEGIRRKGGGMRGAPKCRGDVGGEPRVSDPSQSHAADSGEGLQPGGGAPRGECGSSPEGGLPTHGRGEDDSEDDHCGLGTDGASSDAWIADRPLSIGELRERTIHALNKQRRKRGDGSGAPCLSEKMCLLATPALDPAGSCSPRQQADTKPSIDGEGRDGVSAASTPGGGTHGSRRAPRSGSAYARSHRGLFLPRSRGKEKVFVQLSKKRAGERAPAAGGSTTETREIPPKPLAASTTQMRRKTDAPRENRSRDSGFRKRASGPTLPAKPSKSEEAARSRDEPGTNALGAETADAPQADSAASRKVATQETGEEVEQAEGPQATPEEKNGGDKGTDAADSGRGQEEGQALEREEKGDEDRGLEETGPRAHPALASEVVADHEEEQKGEREREGRSPHAAVGHSGEEEMAPSVTDEDDNKRSRARKEEVGGRDDLEGSSEAQEGSRPDRKLEPEQVREERREEFGVGETSRSVDGERLEPASEANADEGRAPARGDSASEERSGVPLRSPAFETQNSAPSDTSPCEQRRESPRSSRHGSTENLAELFERIESLGQERGDDQGDNGVREGRRCASTLQDSRHSSEDSSAKPPRLTRETAPRPTEALERSRPASNHSEGAKREDGINCSSAGPSETTPSPTPPPAPLPLLTRATELEGGAGGAPALSRRSTANLPTHIDAASESAGGQEDAPASALPQSQPGPDQTEDAQHPEASASPAAATELSDASQRRPGSRPVTPTAWHPGVWPRETLSSGDRSRLASAGESVLSSYEGEDRAAKMQHLSENLTLCSRARQGDTGPIAAFVPGDLDAELQATEPADESKAETAVDEAEEGTCSEGGAQTASAVADEKEGRDGRPFVTLPASFQNLALARRTPLRPPFSAGARGFIGASPPAARPLSPRPFSSPLPGVAPQLPTAFGLPLPRPSGRPRIALQRPQQGPDAEREDGAKASASESSPPSPLATNEESPAEVAPQDGGRFVAASPCTLPRPRITSGEAEITSEARDTAASRPGSRNGERYLPVPERERDATECGTDPQAGGKSSPAENRDSVALPSSTIRSPTPLLGAEAAGTAPKPFPRHEPLCVAPAPLGGASVARGQEDENEESRNEETEEERTDRRGDNEQTSSVEGRGGEEEGTESARKGSPREFGAQTPLSPYREREADLTESPRLSIAASSPSPASSSGDQHERLPRVPESPNSDAAPPESCLGGLYSSDAASPCLQAGSAPGFPIQSPSYRSHTTSETAPERRPLSDPPTEPSESLARNDGFSRRTRRLQMPSSCFPPQTAHISLLHSPVSTRHVSERESLGQANANQDETGRDSDGANALGSPLSDCGPRARDAPGREGEQRVSGGPQREIFSAFFHFPNALPVRQCYTPGTPPSRSRAPSALAERDEPGNEGTVVAETVFDGRRFTAKVRRVHAEETHGEDECEEERPDGQDDAGEETIEQEDAKEKTNQKEEQDEQQEDGGDKPVTGQGEA